MLINILTSIQCLINLYSFTNVVQAKKKVRQEANVVVFDFEAKTNFKSKESAMWIVLLS